MLIRSSAYLSKSSNELSPDSSGRDRMQDLRNAFRLFRTHPTAHRRVHQLGNDDVRKMLILLSKS